MTLCKNRHLLPFIKVMLFVKRRTIEMMAAKNEYLDFGVMTRKAPT